VNVRHAPKRHDGDGAERHIKIEELIIGIDGIAAL
jgi:hypothetical protein